ncbi:MAG: hypothetical protein ACRCTJ_02215 [Brevinema sp.]
MDTLLQKECPIEGKWDGMPTNEKMIRIKAAQLMGATDNEIEQVALEFVEFMNSWMNPIKYDSGVSVISED